MNITKIEIKQEVMEIPDGRQTVEFAIVPPLTAVAFMRRGEIPTDDVVAQQVSYDVERVWNGSEHKNYLVRRDERGIFNDLIKISSDDMKKAVKEETESLYNEMRHVREIAKEDIRNARWNVSMTIKKLPWYSRLFNNF